MNNSESSETDEKTTITREAPWIHPGAVADLIRSGEAEERDRPALIRLYIRAQMAFFGKPGKSGKAKDYWPDNQTIADCLGVDEYDVQNALRYSDIERIDGGKGRGQGKRFRIVKKERNHGGKKAKRKKGQRKKGQRGKRKMSNQRDQSDSENVESTSDPRNIDGCQQSNQHLQHVESTSAIGVEGDGLEIKGEEGEGGGSPCACAREPKTPPPVSPDSFKNLTAEEAWKFLEPFNLLEATGLSQGYYDAIAKVSGCYRKIADDLDVTSATKCLDGLPPDYRRSEILAGWIHWRACRLPRKWNKETHYFTKFEDTWPEYLETATKTLEGFLEAERAQEAEEASTRMAERERQWEQEQAERRAKHEAFVAELPARESVVAAIKAVPGPETFGYNDAVKWIGTLVAAPGLGLVMERSPYEYSYIESAYRAVEYASGAMIERTKAFFGRINIKVLEQLRGDEASQELKPMKIKWENFCDHFGLDDRKARLCGFRIPSGAINYKNPTPSDGPDGADISPR